MKIIIFILSIAVIVGLVISCNTQSRLCVLYKDKDSITYLTFIEYDNQSALLIGNGDYFLRYGTEIRDKTAISEYIKDSQILHVIPDSNDRFRFEILLLSSTFYEYGKDVGHAEPSGEWCFVGYSDNEDSEAAKVLKYYNEHIKK